MKINWSKVKQDFSWVLKQLPMWIAGGLIGFYGPELLVQWNPLGLKLSEPQLYFTYVIGAMAAFILVLFSIIAALKIEQRYVQSDKE